MTAWFAWCLPPRLHWFAPVAAAALLGGCAGGPQPAAEVQVSASPAPATAAAAPGAPASLPRLAPTNPPESLGTVERYAWQSVVQLGEDFAAGDVNGFLARVSSGFYRGYPALEASLRALVAGTRARSAVVAVREVRSEEGRVSVRAEWTRTLTHLDGTVDARHGETTFLFLRGDTSLRLLDYRGAPPFGIAGI